MEQSQRHKEGTVLQIVHLLKQNIFLHMENDPRFQSFIINVGVTLR